MPVFQQVLLLAILQCQHESETPASQKPTVWCEQAQAPSLSSESHELAQGQYIFQIINRSLSNEAPQEP